MAIRQYTTPTLPLFIPGEFIADADAIYVTFDIVSASTISSGGKRECPHGNFMDGEADCITGSGTNLPANTFTGDDFIVSETEEGTTILLPLSQDQTSKFSPGDVIKIQVNWIKNSKRYATDKASVPVTDNLLKVVLPL